MSTNMNNGILDEAKDNLEPAESSQISQSELERIVQWNQEDPEIIDDCAHRLFERRAQQQPDAPAVAAWDVDLSYGELDRAADRLARHLAGRGCHMGPGAIVHTCFEKSGWHVVAVLAINKAGAAWAPLDPSHPARRKRQVVAQTGAALALASPANSEACRGLGLAVVEVSPGLDAQLAAAEEEDKGAAEARARCELPPPLSGSATSARDAAYVLFTSGSTGAPKGIVMEHGALCTSQAAIGRRLGLVPDVRVLQFASYVFDVSVGEILAPLIAGACVCVPDEAARMSTSGLARFVRRRAASWAFLTPSLAGTLDPADFPGLQMLVLMGEAVGRDVLELWFGRVPRLLNGWGPTETCVFSAFHEWKSAEEHPSKIGSPVAGRCWVVDAEDPQRLLPVGSTGEVVVQGPTLLREYLGDAELTRAAVITPVPRWAPRYNLKHWDRLYRTGDLAYHDADGGLIYQGRKDAQVKLRGLRVELGEIESQIRGRLAGGGVQHVAVDVIRREGGTQVLVAFLGCESREGDEKEDEMLQSNRDGTLGIFRPGPLASAAMADMTDYLSTVLPDYMVPRFFLHLRRMPFTLSTKLDRKALRAAAQEMSADELAEVALVDGRRSTTQQSVNGDDGKESELSGEYKCLRDVWSRLLNVNKKYLHGLSHFLSLGGDSIAAIRLAEAVRSEGLELPVSLIFQHPHLSDMARQVRRAHGQEEPAPEPFSLLAEKCSRALIDTVCADCAVSEDSIQDIYPCTPLQVGIMTVFARQPTCYVINYVYSLPQTVDLARFRAAWTMAHSALAILRTRIVLGDDGEYLQVVVKGDMSWTQPPAAGEWTRGVSGIAAHGMGLGTPLVAFGLVPRHGNGNTGHDFSLTIHHAVYDGWSLTSTIRLVEHAYAAGRVPPDIPSYSSFVRFVQQKNNAACADYWRSRLASAPEPSFPPFPGKTYQPLDDSVSTKAVRVPKEHDTSSGVLATRATLCQVAWGLLLAKHEGGDDVVFGSTLSGRNADVRGVGDMHGPTLATVPIRLAFDRDQRVVSLLQAAQKRHGEAMEHEQYGLANISRLGPDERRACAYRTALIIQTPEFEALQSSDEAAVMRLESSSATVYGAPLTVTVRIGQDSDEVTARYDSRLLSEAQVSRLLQQYSHALSILSGVDPGADTKISDLDFCCPSDWAQILQINPRLPDRLELCIHDLFRTAAKKHAGRRALQAWDGAVTYEQLDRLSDGVGRHLVRLGVGPEALVPLCFDKSKWAIVAMLGVLKAGGAYVPLDPGHPDARLAMILEDLDAKVAVTSAPYSNRLAFAKGLTAVVLDETTTFESFDDSVSSGPDSSLSVSPANSVKPHNAAYVLFTSGSTGRPKGIVQTHDAYCTGALGRAGTIHRNEESRVLQFASYGFDPSIEDILTTLLHGGCVCVPSNSDRQGDIGLYIRQNACDFANLTPSFAATINPAEVPSLKILMTSGEPMTDDFVRAWAPHVTLMNGYGPTETSLKCSLNRDVSVGDSPRNIGFPVCANLWVLDPSDPERLAPMGAPGELMVEGPCIARGYLRPGAAAAANGFCEPPGWLKALRKGYGSPSTRLFRTGDLVRYTPDGSIDYISRRDSQVKINGQRTELGEIEAQIRRLLPESSRLTVQMVPTPRQPDGMLTACVAERAAIWTGGPESDPVSVTNISRPSPAAAAAAAAGGGRWWDSEELSAPSLRERLSRVLPAYMIPRAFFAFDPLPLNINGKVNAREILALLSRERVENENTGVEEGHVAVEDLTDGERSLLQLWEKSMRADLAHAGPSSNFFDLGGDSLAALRLAAFARRQGLVLPVAVIHENPTLRDMASLSAAASSSSALEPPPYVPFSLLSHLGDRAEIVRECGERCGVDTGSIEDVYPCTPYQEHFMVHAIWYPGQCVFQGVFPLGADVDVDRFRRAVDVVVQSHHSLRARMTLVNGTWLQVVVNKPRPVEWKPTRSLQQVWRDHTAVTMMDGDELNLFAVVEGEGEGARAQFVWTTNHAISDGWSLSALVHQINTAYAAGTSTLEHESTFAHFIRHAILRPDVDVAARQAFWEDHFRGNESKPLCPLVDSPLVDRHWHREFSPPAPRPDNPLPVSMSTAILAAWGLVVGRETGSPDAVLSLLQLGRDAPLAGAEDMVGLLATAFPFRITTNVNTNTTTRTTTTRAFLLATQARLNAARHHQYTHTDFVAARCGEGASRVPATQTRCVVHPAEFRGGAAPGPADAVQPRTHRTAVRGECIEVSVSFSHGRVGSNNVVGMDLSFDSRALGRAAARRLTEGFETALVQLVGAPAGMCLGDLVWDPSPAVRENGVVETDLSRGPGWTPYPDE